MKTKNILIGSGIFLGGYIVGKVVGSLRTLKVAIDIGEELSPGLKREFGYCIVDRIYPIEKPEESK